MNNLEDITALPEEVIEINMEQNVPNSFTPELLSKILDYLVCARKKGMKLVAVKAMAQYFKVEYKELDEWLKTHHQVERKVSDKDIIYYGLTKITEITSLDSPEFKTTITMILSEDDKMWKSIQYIVSKINNNPIKFNATEIEAAVMRCDGLLRKTGDKDVVYYGLSDRIIKKEEKPKEKPKKCKPCAPEDNKAILMALSMLHPNCDSLLRIMNFYGNKIATNHTEAYAFLAKAQKNLSRGVSLLMNDLKISDKNLPDLEKI